METNFVHHQSAHCENGVASNLLKHQGINISEPMVFGIGSGLFFFYLPLLKVNHAPAISYRPMPGFIFNKAAKRLGIKVKRVKFSNPQSAQKALEDNLKNNIPSGLQVGVYNLTYFPDEYRFHFNAHNLVVYGKKDDTFLISDPVMETVTTLTEKELEKVRFAKGALAPKGQMYYPVAIPAVIDWETAIKKGIKNTCNDMLAPVPIVGVSAMRFLSRSIRKWPAKKGVKVANHYLAQLVRMQEEIGTGGGGFRFIYAAFLQEASVILKNEKLKELSLEMTTIGDLWRDFAVNAARVYKNRSNQTDVYNSLADELLKLADLEEAFFKKLKKAI
ncbi:butirosin biosynthesis protein H-like [Flavobacterium cauense R2A-7]|uniref:Butirosin biosynthesis protein H-like n=1 Tax=Flavobacterium cauense R2A-7 TaxID=1341154 RepID=A0A562LXF1_9FLAO|nr:BtrH N-terminal domain-containing protein [Flavobacterium cauense]KGO83718.1 peptidase [Flavobacterium cauense R2A-7]TWI12331.1 butirosin biosynthesis protein H-like [Flavobacterium cauense R2A-7]